MSKFIFVCEDEAMPFSEGVETKRTFEFNAVSLNDIIAEFELFLRGSGFNLPGILTFAEDDCVQEESFKDECAQEATLKYNSGYDYDLSGSDTNFQGLNSSPNFTSKGFR